MPYLISQHAHSPIDAITLDLGNTGLKLVAWCQDRVICHQYWAWRDQPADTWQQVSDYIATIMGLSLAVPVVLSSVVPSQTAALMGLLNRRCNVRVIAPKSLPCFSLGQYNADQLGTDRWVNALAASQRFTSETLMIISMGTSTTIDRVTSRSGMAVFEGGAILPGLALFAQCLSGATDRLPPTPIPKAALYEPATTTMGCLQTGLAIGYVAMIQGFVAAWKPDTVVLTGGDAPDYKNLDLDSVGWHHEPLLSHYGLLAAFRFGFE